MDIKFDDQRAWDHCESADSLLMDCYSGGNVADLETAIYLLCHAAYSWDPSDPELWKCVGTPLSTALAARFSYTENVPEVGAIDPENAKDVETAAMVASAILAPVDVNFTSGVLESMDFEGSEVEDSPHDMLNCATIILTQFFEAVDLVKVDEAISGYRQALSLCSPSHPPRREALHRLAEALLMRFRFTHQADVRREALTVLQELLPLQHSRLVCACAALLTHAEGPGDPEPILKALYLLIPAFTMMQSDDEATELKSSGAESLEVFLQSGNASDLDSAIASLEKAKAGFSEGHPSMWSVTNYLAVAIHERSTHRGDPSDLDRVIELHREALELVPLPDPGHDTSGGNLAIALRERSVRDGDKSGIDEAVSIHTEILARQPDDHVALVNLAVALHARFDQFGSEGDLDRAIELYRECAEFLPPSHPQNATYFKNLAGALYSRYRHRGDSSDLNEMIELNQNALALDPTTRSNLGVSLQARFGVSGDLVDLDSAVELHRAFLNSLPSTHIDRATALGYLVEALRQRFQHRRDALDIDNAVEMARQALAFHPAPHADRAKSLNNLAATLSDRYRHGYNTADLNESIEHNRAALKLWTSHPWRCVFLSNLGGSLNHRFYHTKDVADIEDSIEAHREALSLISPLHPDRAGYISNLTLALWTKFEHAGQNMDDLDESITLQRESVNLRLSPHPARSDSLYNLGITLSKKYKSSLDSRFLDEAIVSLREASLYTFAPISRRFNASKSWAEYADRFNHESALEAYRIAIELLPQMAMLGLDLTSRQEALPSGSAGLACNAAACAIQLQKYDEAIQFLEAGRSVFWSQALQLRIPLDDLHSSHPELARRASELLTELENGSHRDKSSNWKLPPTSNEHTRLDAEAMCYRTLNADWAKVLHDIRELEGFEDFLRAMPLAKLQTAATNGPVVILNPAKSGCTALVVTATEEIKCIPLPKLIHSNIKKMIDVLREVPSESTFQIYSLIEAHSESLGCSYEQLDAPSRLEGQREGSERLDIVNLSYGVILAMLWSTVVSPIFVALDLKKSAAPPRLWWCPTGPLAFLPIHAAGLYDAQTFQSIDCASDYIISSYVPNLASLLDPPKNPDNYFKMTTLIAEETQWLTPLPGVRAELLEIEKHVPRQWLTTLGNISPPSMEDALDHLAKSSIMHFACHGIQNFRSPLESGLFISDVPLKVSQIMSRKLAPDDGDSIKTMSLAFLSACETAKGDTRLPDEAMHLAATLLFTGFRGVVATMWKIDDRDGPKVANKFYEHLFRNCIPDADPPVLPDLTGAAEALQIAVTQLREEPNMPFTRWVPFVHYGL
ncbi:CHAT domain-containing protein [Mycena vulgaris]|nr:CHAT domain-containing protein [Mycena vulgaris]